MPNWMSQERVRLIQSLGADIIPVSAEQGGFLGSIRMAEEYATTHGRCFLPRQFDNPANIAAHYESKPMTTRTFSAPPYSSASAAITGPSTQRRNAHASNGFQVQLTRQ